MMATMGLRPKYGLKAQKMAEWPNMAKRWQNGQIWPKDGMMAQDVKLSIYGPGPLWPNMAQKVENYQIWTKIAQN